MILKYLEKGHYYLYIPKGTKKYLNEVSTIPKRIILVNEIFEKYIHYKLIWCVKKSINEIGEGEWTLDNEFIKEHFKKLTKEQVMVEML